MTDKHTITVHAAWTSSRQLAVWAEDYRNRPLLMAEAKRTLFTWHEPSFYGTLLETGEWDDKEVVLLSAYEAVSFLASPPLSLFAAAEWSEETDLLRKAAACIHEALAYGWYAPALRAAGQIGWRVLSPMDGRLHSELQELSEAFEESWPSLLDWWLEEALRELVRADSKVGDAWEQLTAQHPALLETSLRDEEDWQVAVGWKQDEVPFRTCLRLEEPGTEEMGGEGGVSSEWRLRLLLQDKEDSRLQLAWNSSLFAASGEAVMPEHWRPYAAERVSKDIRRIIEEVPMVAVAHAEAGDYGAATEGPIMRDVLDDDEAWTFLEQSSIALLQAGFTVYLPAWWEELRRMKPRLKAKVKSSAGGSGNSLFGLQQLIDFDWKIAVGDLELDEKEFMQLAAEKKRLMYVQGRWIELDPAFLEKMQLAMNRTGSGGGMSLRDALELYLLGQQDGGSADGADASGATDSEELQIELELSRHLQKIMVQLSQTKQIPIVDTPEDLQAELRKYQLEGVSWLLFMRRFGLGACLADDMGLGKTIQFISYLLYSRKEKHVQTPALLVCPTSVLGNWQKELAKFAPSLKVHLHYGPNRAKGETFGAAMSGYDLVMTSYNLAQLDEEELGSVLWDVICLDEAQNIKNAYTKQSTSIRGLQGKHRIALTGTPIENRLTELWTLFDFINPGYLGNMREFQHNYVNAIEKTRDEQLVLQVQKLVKPFLLRRHKKDPFIQLDLPDKQETKVYVGLTGEQAALYENVVQELLDKIEKATGIEKKGVILAALTKLKQICDHPALFLKEPASSVSEKGASAEAEERSVKLGRLLEMVNELREEGDNCLIFTQFVEMGYWLKAALEQERGEQVLYLHGGVSKAQRDEMVSRFQDRTLPEKERPGIFVLSLKAGGTGLNLTSANHVFHFDRWWNPAVENQATDRAFRIGQTKDVQVHKFVTLGTLEERIDEMIERKLGLSEQIVGAGENWVTELSTDELKDLFVLRREWIGK